MESEFIVLTLDYYNPTLFCKDGCYVPLDLPTPLIVEIKHNCTDISRRVITCFHSDGKDSLTLTIPACLASYTKCDF